MGERKGLPGDCVRSLWGPTPALVLPRLLWVRQWGQDLVPLPQLKIAAWAVWKAPGPVGGGSSRASAWGGEEGGGAGNACALPTPPAKSGVSGHSPLESPRGALGPTQGRNLLIPQAGPCPADPSWPGLVSCHGHKEGRRKVVLSPCHFRTDDLNCLTLHSLPSPSQQESPSLKPAVRGCQAEHSVCPPRCLLSISRVLPKGGLFRNKPSSPQPGGGEGRRGASS